MDDDKAMVDPVKGQELVAATGGDALVALAVHQKMPVEAIEKLVDMVFRIRAEEARMEYFRALAKFQGLCPIVVKGRVVMNKPEKGGGVRYRYAPLDVIVAAVKKYLARCGFSYTIGGVQTDTTFMAVCQSQHTGGHSERTEFMIPVEASQYMNGAQQVATAQSYAKRYAFCNAFGILTGEEDTDAIIEPGGHAVSISGPKEAAPTVPQEKPAKSASELVGRVEREISRCPSTLENTRIVFTARLKDLKAKKNWDGIDAMLAQVRKQAQENGWPTVAVEAKE